MTVHRWKDIKANGRSPARVKQLEKESRKERLAYKKLEDERRALTLETNRKLATELAEELTRATVAMTFGQGIILGDLNATDARRHTWKPVALEEPDAFGIWYALSPCFQIKVYSDPKSRAPFYRAVLTTVAGIESAFSPTTALEAAIGVLQVVRRRLQIWQAALDTAAWTELAPKDIG